MDDYYETSLKQNMLNAIGSIRSDVEVSGYSVWRSEESLNLIENSRKQYLKLFKSLPLHPQTEKFKPDNLETNPWRKLCVGASNGIGDPYAQFLTTTYLNDSNINYGALSSLFDLMIVMRNTLTGMPVEFGKDSESCGYWNACRIHHYPRGGGFMSEHRDTHFPSVLDKDGIPFLQVMACLSKPNEHFDEGGGFIRSKKGSKVPLDNTESYGSFVFFDGAMRHGVDTVDAHIIPDFLSPLGRVAAFSNLYEIL